MGREVRRVPADWKHPLGDNGKFEPVFNAEMPRWSSGEATHYQMYETNSAGTPISPVRASAEELARWLVEHQASAYGDETASYDAWLHVAKGNPAFSFAFENGEFINGVEYCYRADRQAALPETKRDQSQPQHPLPADQEHQHAGLVLRPALTHEENTMSNQDNQTDTEKGRRPDFIAYQVTEMPDGKGLFSRCGAAWAHKDGQGYQLQLDSVPVDGRITLRELREERMQQYAEEREAESTERTQSRGKHRGRAR